MPKSALVKLIEAHLSVMSSSLFCGQSQTLAAAPAAALQAHSRLGSRGRILQQAGACAAVVPKGSGGVRVRHAVP